MNSKYYNQNYTSKEIEVFLEEAKQCIKENRYIVSIGVNRQENQKFIYEYNLRSKKIKDILMGVRIDDFCHTLVNNKPGYEHEILYVFVPVVELFNVYDKKEKIPVYIKYNLCEIQNGKRLIVISFHRLNKQIKYAFK